MISQLVRWTRARHAPTALFFASVAESTFVPIPIEIVMTPMMVADRRRNFLFATMVFLGCLAGSLVMYGVGFLAFETVGRFLIDSFGWQEAHGRFQAFVAEDGALAVAAIAITPIPLVIAALGAGAAGMNVLLFLAILGVTRAIRYFGIAVLVHLFGRRAERLLLRYQESAGVRALVWGLTLLVIAGLVLASLDTLTGAASS